MNENKLFSLYLYKLLQDMYKLTIILTNIKKIQDIWNEDHSIIKLKNAIKYCLEKWSLFFLTDKKIIY